MAKRTTALRFQSGTAGTGRVPFPAGKKQLLSIERLAHDGRGIAFTGGYSWFVSGALPGEQVQVRVLGMRGKVVEACTSQVLEASPLRQAPRCPHAGQCGGCSLQHLPEAEQLALKQRSLAGQLKNQGLEPRIWDEPLSGPAWGYRRRARLAVRWDPACRQLAVGFRALSSQQIVPVCQCPVLVPALQLVLPELVSRLQALAEPRRLGHVELLAVDSGCALLVRHLGPLAAADHQALVHFCQAREMQLWLQDGQVPAQVDTGKPGLPLAYTLAPGALAIGCQPGDFVQVNAAVNQAMVSRTLDWLSPPSGGRLLDLFCGLGNFSLPLAACGAEVTGVEGSAEMVARARLNAGQNGLAAVHFYQADLSKPLPAAPWSAGPFAAVLLDPPREGARAVAGMLAGLGAQQVLYVSCNPATLARDAALLQQQGYRPERACVLDMFPQTAHAEAMVLFARA